MSAVDPIEAAKRWIAEDPDPVTRAGVEAWLDRGDAAELAAAFGSQLTFGTAGLRGAMGPGTSRMNRLMVRRVSAGLARHLLGTRAAPAGVVIGFDGRHHSRAFAEEAAEAFTRRGVPVWTFDDVVPTPVLAYATVALGAGAGVMVTASHNPPEDNGYKVYRANGAQIISPDDALITEAMAAPDGPLPAEPAARRAVPAEVVDAYHAAIQGLRVHPVSGARVVYTAMHGVGTASVQRAFAAAGHTDLHLVEQQAWPDGDFPTVKFPNPEEPGALDLSIALARAVDADVILASDPDADRLAVAAPLPDGTWRQLTGNQVGVILADDLLRSGFAGDKRAMVATSIVSSAMLARIAAAHGADYAETLTGFKWIGHRAIEHDAAGGQFVFGFEEALGYTAGSVVRDKDGVSSALLMADLVSSLKAAGQTLWQRLDELYASFGLYVSRQRSLVLTGAEGQNKIRDILARLGANPPESLAGTAVEAVRDLAVGMGRRRDGTMWRIDLPSSDVLCFDLEDGSRVLVRPSGTEPKIKFYFEVRQSLGEGGVAAATSLAEARIAQMVEQIFERAGVST